MSKINLKTIKAGYGIDLEKASKGVWKPLTMVPGAEVLVAMTGNPKYDKLLKDLYEPYSRTVRRGKKVPQAVQEKITNELIARTILLDWKGMPGEDGQDVPFSVDEAVALLSDPELKSLRDEISDYADEFASFQADEVEEKVKNL